MIGSEQFVRHRDLDLNSHICCPWATVLEQLSQLRNVLANGRLEYVHNALLRNDQLRTDWDALGNKSYTVGEKVADEAIVGTHGEDIPIDQNCATKPSTSRFISFLPLDARNISGYHQYQQWRKSKERLSSAYLLSANEEDVQIVSDRSKPSMIRDLVVTNILTLTDDRVNSDQQSYTREVDLV